MLTTEQRATLKTFVLAQGELSQLVTDKVYSAIADWLNTKDVSNYTVWKTAVYQDEIMQNGFDWAQVDNLTVGKARIWEWMFDNQGNSINPSKLNVRAGIDETWKGTTAMLAVRAQVYTHCKRLATRVEKLFASGVGSDASPATLGIGTDGYIQGEISTAEVQFAME